ncbi:hypothetical protein FOA52_006142 [Chlamydomonas sp. UWO 241]|nr:hypothetical protein FOA52_006142 [Chlamydomonas sp. UWO 241]
MIAVEASASTAVAFGTSSYGTTSSSIPQLCNKLRELGVCSEIQLPTLVIAGNQSSGKSSVVEALAGIPLPRSIGTCTRCPTEVRMRQAPPVPGTSSTGWLCHVKLKREYDAEGRELIEVPQEEKLVTIFHQAHLTECVTTAQAVLLNPTLLSQQPGGAKAFLPEELRQPGGCKESKPVQPADALTALENKFEHEFTNNSIVLEIQGAEADLTIVDLPGIIQSHDTEMFVDMIKAMVAKNIAPEHVCIVMTLTGMDDLENQAINRMAREADKQGIRTIGVITKADAIPEGAHGPCLRLPLNENLQDEKSLFKGYYAVKNPGQKQLNDGITFQQARESEAMFFRTDPVWSQEIKEELKRLPPKPGDMTFEFPNMLYQMAKELDDLANAVAADKSFYQSTDKIYRVFSNKVKGSLPTFKVKETIIGLGIRKDEEEEEHTVLMSLDKVKELRQQSRGRELPTFSSVTMDAHLDGLADVCSDRVEKLASMEECATFTMNDHSFTDSKTEFLAKLKRANLGMLDTGDADSNSNTSRDTILSYLKQAGMSLENLDEVWLAQTTPEDDELNMMAAALAYCKVSFKRVEDMVPLHIRTYLVFSFANKDNLPRDIFDELTKKMADLHTGASLPVGSDRDDGGGQGD